jgi:hypothetical protein
VQLLRRLPSRALLIHSLLFMLAWTAQMLIWYRCEISAKWSTKPVPKMCPERGGFLTVGQAKAPLGLLTVISTLCTMAVAAAQVDRDRMAFSVSGIPKGFWI